MTLPHQRILTALFFSFFALLSCTSRETHFVLVDENEIVTLVVDAQDNPTVKLAANLFAQDVERITGVLPKVVHSVEETSGTTIIIGSLPHSKLLEKLNANNALTLDSLNGKWEVYGYRVANDLLNNNEKTLIIAGSDPRGTAYGIFDLSQKIGVSPWYYWADVTPEKKDKIQVNMQDFTSETPSVKFRGIFLNDEDWGLQPWAAKTLEPETNDIGPKTYAHIFELLLRLKANLIWPAMHPCTRGFFTYPGNVEVAEKYGITIGSSHCEQMLCNNVDEWKEPEFGPFNYFTNKNKMVDYWANRVEQSKNINGIYTLGLRGVHDSGIVGAKNNEQKISATNEVIKLQRHLLDSIIDKPVAEIPQVMIPYKEVLAIYDQGIDLPQDITLVWPDDNYGYVRRLSNAEERKRSGGSGVYYHASYWGRPHDYLWLSSANPWVMYEEMYKAYRYDARNLWILNVGDIKPLERDMDLFLDMAYNIQPYKNIKAVNQHMTQWYANIFGETAGKAIAEIMTKYYQLALERRPEFMGWSRTEGSDRGTHISDYNPFVNNDEAQKRLDAYRQLESEVKSFYQNLDPKDIQKDAFYQLVYYPVVMAAEINRKFLYRDRAELYKKEGRTSANEYAQKSAEAYDEIVAATSYFNNELSVGKWKYMMSYEPRGLSVYQKLDIDTLPLANQGDWGISMEKSFTDTARALPTFYPWYNGSYFFDIFMKGTEEIDWKLKTNVPWIVVSSSEGKLENSNEKREQRVWVKINWSRIFDTELSNGTITLEANGKMKTIAVKAMNFDQPDLIAPYVPIETDGIISIFAENFRAIKNAPTSKWVKMEGLGHTGAAMQHLVDDEVHFKQQFDTVEKAELLYEFIVVDGKETELTIFALPTHPINQNWDVSVAVSLDGESLGTASVKNRSQSRQWKENVLRNTSTAKLKLGYLKPGKHTLKITAQDPEFVLDRLLISPINKAPKVYSVIPETRLP